MTEQTTNSFIFSSEGEGLTVTPNLASLSEETIDLGTLFVDSVSPTGSFDLRRSRLSSFGKLLEAIPIPTMLVDESYHIIFANRACNRPGIECGKIEGSNFSALFPNQADGQQAKKLIQKVFHNRMPLIAEGILGWGQMRIRGRIHLRSLRIQKIRTMLVIIEDITSSTHASATV